MPVLVVVLLKVYFEEKIFLDYSVTFSLFMSFLIISAIKHKPAIGILLCQIFQAHFQYTLIQIFTLFSCLLILDSIIVVIFCILLERVIITYNTVASHAFSSTKFLTIITETSFNKHALIDTILCLFSI